MFDLIWTLLDPPFTGSDEHGASAVEYGLLIAGIAALVAVAVFALGPIVNETFTDTCDEIAAAPSNTTVSANC